MGCHVGEHELYCLKTGNRLIELLALFGIIAERRFVGSLSDTQSLSGDADAATKIKRLTV